MSTAASLLATHGSTAWSLHGNLGLMRNSYRESEAKRVYRNTVWRVSAAASYALDAPVRLLVDIGAKQNIERGNRKNPAFALVGVIYSPTKALDLDIGIKMGLNEAEADRQFGAGFTFRF
jgi:hypothetical protein